MGLIIQSMLYNSVDGARYLLYNSVDGNYVRIISHGSFVRAFVTACATFQYYEWDGFLSSDFSLYWFRYPDQSTASLSPRSSGCCTSSEAQMFHKDSKHKLSEVFLTLESLRLIGETEFLWIRELSKSRRTLMRVLPSSKYVILLFLTKFLITCESILKLVHDFATLQLMVQSLRHVKNDYKSL